MSWKPLIRVDEDSVWCANAWRFGTKDEAIAAARWVADHWMAVIDWDVQASNAPVNYRMGADRPEKISR